MKTTSDYILAFSMLVTGSINTISTKLADRTETEGVSENGVSAVHEFNHPFFQACGMFLGEFLCFLAFKFLMYTNRGPPPAKPFSPFVLLLPAMCDMCGTSLMYVGLTMTDMSVFQMLRGTVVIFTAILSKIFLGRKLFAFHWTAVAMVAVGAALVGLASILPSDSGSSDDSSSGSGSDDSLVWLGDILIIGAQLIVAVQMCVEEKFLSKYHIPALQAVGWEGMWGFLVLGLLLIPFYWLPGQTYGDRLENTPDALAQIGNSWIIGVALLGNVFSIAFFNFFGISVTKQMSASHRMVLDSVRTIVVWAFSLAVGWEVWATSSWLQVGGFVILMAGTAVYNEIIKLPGFVYPDDDLPASKGEGYKALLDDDK